MKKQTLINALIYLVCMVSACILNLAVSWMMVKIVDSFVELGYFRTAIVRIVSGIVTGGVVLGAVVFRDSYKSICFSPKPLTVSLLLAGLGHLLLCLVLMFHPFIAGGVRYLAGILRMGGDFASDGQLDRIYLWDYLLGFLIDFAVRVAVALLCGYLGKKKRLDNRKNIAGYPSENETEG